MVPKEMSFVLSAETAPRAVGTLAVLDAEFPDADIVDVEVREKTLPSGAKISIFVILFNP